MHGGQITAVIIVALIVLGSIVRSLLRGVRHATPVLSDQANFENRRLREEVQELKERIKVLERITVEKENSLANEIESLRNK